MLLLTALRILECTLLNGNKGHLLRPSAAQLILQTAKQKEKRKQKEDQHRF